MEKTNPSMEHSSLLAEGAYSMGTKGNKNQRINDTNELVKETGYQVSAPHSNSEITTYIHKDDPKNVFIAHRGTQLKSNSRRNEKHNDLTADLMFAVGMGGHEAKMKSRKKKTNEIIKELNPTQLHLGGHSLGGGTVNDTIVNSKTVRKHLTSAQTFNAAANPVFTNGLNVSGNKKKILDEKVTHHRIKNDGVSAGFLTNLPFGKLKTHSIKHDTNKGKSMLQNFVENTTSLGRAKLMTEKGAFAHGIDHFHSGIIKKKKKKNKKK